MENLTAQTFKEKVFDYTQNGERPFKGTKPAIIDFYADWCGPCKTIAPILDELNRDYPAIDIYKVDIDTQNEIAEAFKIRSVPSVLFIPTSGQPQMSIGAKPKSAFLKIIKDIFGIE